jgi:hypothetical protein
MKHCLSLIVVTFCLLLTSPVPAAAYLDPATGSIVLQVAIGGLLAVVTATQLYWRRLRSLLSGKRKEDADAATVRKGD